MEFLVGLECKLQNSSYTTGFEYKICKEDRAENYDASYYRSLIGSLLYLTASRPDLITLAASLLSRFMQNPEDIHFAASKRVLRYLKEFKEARILVQSTTEPEYVAKPRFPLFYHQFSFGKNNSFRGGIPYGLGHLPRLRVIDIQNNQLNGSIPASLFQHRRVQVISLAFNELGGEMWKGPWYGPQFRVLDLTNNSLTGMIPPPVGNATKMMNFSLSGNRVSGNIPKEISTLSQLADLYLTDNQLTGSIPAAPFNISSLLSIHLRYNRLSGPLWIDEGNIVSNLKFLSISNNQISGSIPSNICQLTELKWLSLSFNNITGDIPRNIDCLSKLEGFYIGDNPIKGTILTSLGNISTLQYLYCGNNRIVGIDFSFNNLSGRIPTTTGLHLPNLKGLTLGFNQLEGEIPLFITNASKLEILELNNNSLTGTIPTNLGNLHELCYLILHDNQLTNEPREHELRFFNSLADYRMLRYLQVGNNPLNGTLPNSIGNLSSTIENFNIVDAHINGLSGLTVLSLGGNNLMGNIPPEIGKLKQLQGHQFIRAVPESDARIVIASIPYPLNDGGVASVRASCFFPSLAFFLFDSHA
ncbi:LRR receptor-like serine/threonine-protein kinase FLS2 [Solanum tuberosum]|uniref:LRR receptor-like serine/threonine-protein kinase FLS2 n=1 Tax=Solanum tuberosum TaxID=4113 RepID=UPI00073A17A3|nr:PREDICTED: LRR receptor-like serine/threonine-protein kinase FLS2 [Solanum tuberosum]